MNILVTGALGFVGINIVRTLAAKPDVTVLATDARAPDALARQFLGTVAARVHFATFDITDRAAFHALVADSGATHIIHGAAVTPSLQQERAGTTRVVDVNLGGAINALDAVARIPSVQRFIFVSSSGVYGLTAQAAHGTIGEDAPLVLDNLYAITKRSAELLTARYSVLHGKPMCAVRLGPIYGPMERPSASRERLSAPGQLLAAWRMGRSVTVAGPDVTRDWTYAGDVGEAIWALLAASTWRFGVYNLSYGQTVTLRELVDAFVRQGVAASWVDQVKDADIAMVPAQTRTPMDGTRLHADSGYRPQTDPADGVARTIALEKSVDSWTAEPQFD
jgi:nucleoside-diphosphate-sugar epimerase